MSRKVQWSQRALRATARLDRPTRERILAAIETFATTGEGDVKRLKGDLAGLLRLRVGSWRVILSLTEGRLFVRAVRPRGDAYS